MKKENMVVVVIASLVVIAMINLGCWMYKPTTCVKLVTISKSPTGEVTVTGDMDIKVNGLVMAWSVPLIKEGGALMIHQAQNDDGDALETWFSDK